MTLPTPEEMEKEFDMAWPERRKNRMYLKLSHGLDTLDDYLKAHYWWQCCEETIRNLVENKEKEAQDDQAKRD